MRVAVMGAGSVGGYLGGMLARGGHEVSLIVRGAHLAAIRERGCGWCGITRISRRLVLRRMIRRMWGRWSWRC